MLGDEKIGASLESPPPLSLIATAPPTMAAPPAIIASVPIPDATDSPAAAIAVSATKTCPPTTAISAAANVAVSPLAKTTSTLPSVWIVTLSKSLIFSIA